MSPSAVTMDAICSRVMGARGGRRARPGLEPGALGLGLGDPPGDGWRGRRRVERGPVAGRACGRSRRSRAAARRRRPSAGAGGSLAAAVSSSMVCGQVAGVELAGQPVVERAEEASWRRETLRGWWTLVGQGVLGGEPAPVVGACVGPVALHAPVAHAAEQQAAQRVGVLGAVRLVLARPRCGRRASAGPAAKVSSSMIGGWTTSLGVDPLAAVVPPHLGGVAEGDVVDVEQHLVFALPVPDLAAGVAGVGQDRADGALGPGDAAAVPVAARVVRGRARDAVAGQAARRWRRARARPGTRRRSARPRRRPGSSIASACSRLPSAALAGLGCGPASTSLYP